MKTKALDPGFPNGSRDTATSFVVSTKPIFGPSTFVSPQWASKIYCIRRHHYQICHTKSAAFIDTPSYSIAAIHEDPRISSVKDMQKTVVRKTAACIIIGDEILSGKFQDINGFFLAKFLFEKGINLSLIQVIPDDIEEVGRTVRFASNKYDYVFTSGGIGPTHDDITYEAIAKAFNLSLKLDESTLNEMKRMSMERQIEFHETPGRLQMATLPFPCEILKCPGLWVPIVVVNHNVHILPGIPSLFERMILSHQHLFESKNSAGSRLEKKFRKYIYTLQYEADFSEVLGEIASNHQHLSIGSYPKTLSSQKYNVMISVEGDSERYVDAVTALIQVNVDGSLLEDDMFPPS